MAHPMFGGSFGNPVLRASAITVLVVGVLAAATGALPVQCFTGTICGPEKPATTPLPKLVNAPQPEKRIAVASVDSKPTLTRNDVIAATFAQLDVTLPAPAQTLPKEVITPTADAASETDLKTHVVRTVSIRPDGTPLQVASVDAGPTPLVPKVESAVEVAAVDEPSPALVTKPDEDVQVAAAEPAEVSAPKVDAAPAVHLAAGDVGLINGGGANARNLPSKAKGKVLFTLGPGASITVVERKTSGWLKITDPKGRMGWIYEDYVSKSAT